MACFLLVRLLHQKGIGCHSASPDAIWFGHRGYSQSWEGCDHKQRCSTGSPRTSHCLSRFQCLDYWLACLAPGRWLSSAGTAGCYPEWPSWLQPREHLWDRVACMSNARGLLQFCRFCSLRSDKAPVCLWGAASFGLRQQASGAACWQWLHVAWAGSESVGRTFRVFYPTLGDQCSALLLSVFMWVGPLNRTCTIWIFLSSLVRSTTVARTDC